MTQNTITPTRREVSPGLLLSLLQLLQEALKASDLKLEGPHATFSQMLNMALDQLVPALAANHQPEEQFALLTGSTLRDLQAKEELLQTRIGEFERARTGYEACKAGLEDQCKQKMRDLIKALQDALPRSAFGTLEDVRRRLKELDDERATISPRLNELKQAEMGQTARLHMIDKKLATLEEKTKTVDRKHEENEQLLKKAQDLNSELVTREEEAQAKLTAAQKLHEDVQNLSKGFAQREEDIERGEEELRQKQLAHQRILAGEGPEILEHVLALIK